MSAASAMLTVMETTADMNVARIVVDVPTRALSEPFDYAVPEAVREGVVVGAAVLVPLGGQRVVGYVVGLSSSTEFEGRLKPIEAVLGDAVFRSHAPELARWISREYVCPLADAMHLFLPPGGSPSAIAVYSVAGEKPAGSVRAAVWDEVAGAGALTSTQLRAIDARFADAAAGLARAGVLARTWRLKPSVTGAVDDRWAQRVPDSGFVPQQRSTMQRAVLDALAEGPVRVAELTAELGPVDSALRALASAGAVRFELRRRIRGGMFPARPAPRHSRLSAGQDASLEAIADAAPGTVVLLEGVTGSGKTEVYLRAIEDAIDAGGTAIVLVPEISLTPQTVGRFRSRFGEAIAVLHSRLSTGERYDQWDRVRAGDARVVVGPRSALFAPVSDLRLVVIDEEHDASYKQGSAPRYHARAVAERLCAETGAVLVLGSATPSLESLTLAAEGRYARVELPERVGGGSVPPVTVVDMAAEFRDGHRSMFSRALTAGLQGVAERGAKAVLLLNRRGSASFLLCRECGYVPTCEKCSVSYTYHEVGERLICHHCGATAPVPPRCPTCDSPYLRQFGAGTQRVESELKAVVPDLPVVRMDADTTSGVGGHERRLAEFEALPSGVLLGTQMVAKGLDYPEVELVGVVNADTTLHMPDFRAGERTYQLLEQVAGRAGRGEAGGSVVIQTYWPDHPAILAVASHDPGVFRRQELEERSELGYPPCGRLARVVVSGAELAAVKAAAGLLADAARGIAPDSVTVLGPAPAPLARVKNSYRWHVVLKGFAGSDLPALLSASIGEATIGRDVAIAPDVDPMDMM
jgi:primosomal protein N' (replication factor Y) (superfamily II helicase)